MSIDRIKFSERTLREMEKHSHVNWDAFIEHKINNHLNKISILDKLMEDSELTEGDAIELGRKVNNSMLQAFLTEEK